MKLPVLPPSIRLSIRVVLLAALSLAGIQAMSDAPSSPRAHNGKSSGDAGKNLEKATFGSGCFWCTEAVFTRLKGVESVVSGYSGGHVSRPTYQQVCSGRTGHAEVVQITFDPRQVSYAELLKVFWKTHDPTTPNRQGSDVGTQYRSVIFYHNDEQRKLAEHYKQELGASGAYPAPIVTEIAPFREFFPAEGHHQDYFRLNPSQPYCALVIQPKVEKFEKVFGDRLKDRPSSDRVQAETADQIRNPKHELRDKSEGPKSQ